MRKIIADSELIFLSVSFAFLRTALLVTNSGQLMSILGISVTGFAIAPIFPGLVPIPAQQVVLGSGIRQIQLECRCRRQVLEL